MPISRILTHPGSDTAQAIALKYLIKLAGVDVKISDDKNEKVALTVETVHPVTKIARTDVISGFIPAINYIANLAPEYQLTPTSYESWVQSCVDGSEAMIATFVEKVERYLWTNNQTYLVGDAMSAADVVVAVTIALGANKDKLKLSQNVHRLVCTVVSDVGGIELPALDESSVVDVKPEEKPKKSEENKPSSTNGSSNSNPVLAKLAELGIKCDLIEHEKVVTADDLVEKVKLPEGGVHTKNLFLKDKKHGLFFICVSATGGYDVSGSKVSKIVAGALGLTGKVNMRMTDEQTLKDNLHCAKGCLGPLALALNSKDINVIIDEKLFEKKSIYSHPITNDLSVGISAADLKLFLEKIGVEAKLVNFGGDDAASSSSAATSSAPKPPAPKPKSKPAAAKKDKSAPKKQQANSNKKTAKAGQTLLALQWKKAENFPQWYSDVIVLSEMISYYDISGCYILRPWSYKIWEFIQEYMNAGIRSLGVDNCYFPLFVSKDRLEKEKDHVEGFAPEVAWVTHSGESALQKPIAIRPTSETIMYPTFANLIQSHRDLPLQINQWSNVVRWEFKDPTPFLRSREFLWQEGHTAHSTSEEAEVMVMDALEMYRKTYEELLAVPVIPGYKTEKEKFAGGKRTTTVEAYIPMSGRAIQGATSHDLGQNFGKMFDITFQDKSGKSAIVHQTSWGFTTRSIGVMIMVHGDDTGLVLPPKIAPHQVVIVPIVNKKCGMDKIGPYCEQLLQQISSKGNIRVKYDDRDMYNPGWKYNHWEQKGVPIRLEVGPMDLEKGTARLVQRYNGEKSDLEIAGIGDIIAAKLEDIQAAMFEKAKATRDSHVVQVTEWKDFVPALEKQYLVLTPWCGPEHKEWEEWVKTTSREESLKAGEEEAETAATSVAAKTLCIPFVQPELPKGTKCIASGMDATCWVLWGRSY